MSVHPIESRYGRDEVRRIFEDEVKLQRMLDVEAALVRAHAAVGTITRRDADEVSRKASVKYVKLERVAEIEAETHHDVMAVVKALSEVCGEAGRAIHLGATSNDITDTALALQLKDYIVFLGDTLNELLRVLLAQAKANKKRVCIGRTHGQHAVPTTYGLKFGIWAAEVGRHLERLSEVKKRILVGQMTGAVGTQAAFGGKGPKIQELVMKDLKLGVVLASNQVIQRDRHAEFIMLLALIAESLNKFATEIRNLQRTEIGEVSEGFRKKQVGSSTMPHKRNPIYAERICGLSRIVKANAMASLENIPLWHERDLTNSSPERIIIPEACILTDYILGLSIELLGNLVFHDEAIKRNLYMSKGRIMAEAVMVALTEKGMDRQAAHELVREAAMESYRDDEPLEKFLACKKEVTELISGKELEKILKPENYTGSAAEQVDRIVKKLGK
ncbi:MAG: adenylosuccinate lyase [Candidatus Altiarchaeota archaeon]